MFSEIEKLKECRADVFVRCETKSVRFDWRGVLSRGDVQHTFSIQFSVALLANESSPKRVYKTNPIIFIFKNIYTK